MNKKTARAKPEGLLFVMVKVSSVKRASQS